VKRGEKGTRAAAYAALLDRLIVHIVNCFEDVRIFDVKAVDVVQDAVVGLCDDREAPRVLLPLLADVELDQGISDIIS